MIIKYKQLVLSGKHLSFEQALELANTENPSELYQAADELRRELHSNHFDLCSLAHAQPGKCSENCKFCAHAYHYDVEMENYDVIDESAALALAKESEKYGVEHFSLAAHGRTVSNLQLDEFAKIYGRLREETNLSFCASMGLLTKEKAQRLKAMGVKRYHCNLETCKSFFPEVCTSHTWEDKVKTIITAQEAGLEVCSGGIVGMGETLEQRLELAFELRDLDILSIPLNILTPIAETPFAHLEPLGVGEVLTCVAMFRFINPLAVIRVAGGRHLLGDQQDQCFTSGSNGSIVGDYLNTMVNTLRKDTKMLKDQWFDLDSRPE